MTAGQGCLLDLDFIVTAVDPEPPERASSFWVAPAMLVCLSVPSRAFGETAVLSSAPHLKRPVQGLSCEVQQSASRRSAPRRAGWKRNWPSEDVSVGNVSFDGEGLVVEICLAVADPGRAHGLIQGLADVCAPSSVWFDCARGEVRVRSEWESRAVLRVRDVVESWLAAEGIASAELLIVDCPETLFCPGSGTPVHGAPGRAEKSASFGPRAIESQVKVVDLNARGRQNRVDGAR
jgi:hypothetical protein